MNTVEALKEKCDLISEQIKQIGIKNDSHYVVDGVIDIEKYLNAKYRILWVLKEANSECHTWSYLEKFKDKEWLYRCGKSQTLRRIIYTTYGILRDFQWCEIPNANNEKSFEPLQEIAIINIKKIPGGSVSDPKTIKSAYYENRELLRLQIETYNPNVVIFGNTMRFFCKSDFDGLESAEKQITEYGNHYYDTNEKLYIHTWHPAIRGVDKNYVMDIVNIVRSWEK